MTTIRVVFSFWRIFWHKERCNRILIDEYRDIAYAKYEIDCTPDHTVLFYLWILPSNRLFRLVRLISSIERQNLEESAKLILIVVNIWKNIPAMKYVNHFCFLYKCFFFFLHEDLLLASTSDQINFRKSKNGPAGSRCLDTVTLQLEWNRA